MKTIEEIQAKHAAELAAFQQEQAILSVCPAEPQQVTLHRDSTSVIYRKKYPNRHTFAEAYAIYKAWLPHITPAEDWSNGCRSIHPPRINSAAKGEKASMNGRVHASLKIAAGRGYESHELEFWASVGEQLVNVSIEIRPEWKWLPLTEFRYDKHGECETSKVTPRGIGEDSMVKWWSSPGSYNLQYTWADVHNFRAFASNYLPESDL